MFKRKYVVYLLPVFFSLGLLFLYEKGRTLDEDQLKIGISYMTLNNDFYKTLNAEIEKEMESEDVRVFVRDAELDDAKQSQQIDSFVKQKVEVVVVNPVKSHSKMVSESLKRAKKAGIKTIVVDSPIDPEISVDTTIASDNYQAGVLIAEDLMKQVKQARILILKHQDAFSANQRVKGFLDTIEGHPNYKVVAEKETLGQTEESMPQVLEVLETGESFDVILSLNDRAAIGALAAIEDQHYAGKMLIYGVDGSPDIKAFLTTKNALQGSVAQSPIQMGQKVAEVIFYMASHQDYQSEYAIPVQLITRENRTDFSLKGWQ